MSDLVQLGMLPAEGAKTPFCGGCPKEKETCVTRGIFEKDARITFIAESPSALSIDANAPMRGQNGILLRKFMKSFDQQFRSELESRGQSRLPYSVVYAVGAEGKPKKVELQKCSQLWKSLWLNEYTQQSGVHVIVPLGMSAAKSAGLIGRKIFDIRGKVIQGMIGSKPVHVIPTLSLPTAYVKTGLASVMQQDIQRALRIAYFEEKVETKSIEELAETYTFPRTLDEVRKLCDDIIQYFDPAKQSDPFAWPITVDTETNTLKPFRKDAKVLMVSFAWDTGKACAILLDHPKNTWYDPKEAWKEVARVLECPKPKATHNGKYDIQFLERVYGMRVNNLMWDTMCGQHWMSEDQKGVYGLKALAPSYAPSYEGYEDKLHDALREGEEAAPTEEDVQKEAAELAAAAGASQGNISTDWMEDDTVDSTTDQSEDDDPNNNYRDDPVFFDDTTEEQKTEYKRLRDTWFDANDKGDVKTRKKIKKQWNKLCKELGLPELNLEDKEVVKNEKKDVGFENINIETLLPYAAADADVTRLILRGQFGKIMRSKVFADAESVMQNLYLPASRTLGGLEFRGCKVDLAKAQEYDSQLSVILDATMTKIYNLTLRRFNINANKQLGEILLGMGFEVIKRTKTNLMATSKDVISSYQAKLVTLLQDPTLSETDRAHHTRRLELTEALLLYRAANKMKTSFLKRLREYAALDGNIHTTFHLTGTATGRLSSAKLNLQNLPLYMCHIVRPNPNNPEEPLVIHEGFNVKSLLIPSDKDEVFWNLDIKAAEIRVLCYYSQDKGLIQAVSDNLDIHTYFLTRVRHPGLTGDRLMEKYYHYFKLYKDDDEEISQARTKIKRVVFGILYGAGVRKIAAEIKGTPDQAQELINALFTSFPGIQDYIYGTKKEAASQGYVKTIFGRYRRFLMLGVAGALRAKAEREAVNFKIQSTSSDLVVSQLCEIDQHLHEIDAVMRLTVHDSMGGTIKRNRVKDMKQFFDYWLVDRIKEKFPWLPVPFLYDLEIGPSYGEKTKYSQWLKDNPDVS